MEAQAKQQPLAINPGKGLGFLLLGSSLKDILTRLRSQPELFPKLKIQFGAAAPLLEPLNIVLPENGLRLRFDGPDQRLRLIEVLEFSKVPLTYKGQDLVKIQEGEQSSGPSFRHVYSKLFGPTFEGEHFTATSGKEPDLYVLSYPGVAFSFRVLSWPENSDFVSVLSSSSTSSAVALSIFNGPSWKSARKDLYSRICPHPRSLSLVGRAKESMPDEIELAVIKGQGHVEFRRRALPPFNVLLGVTTPQDLVLTLGPPDAIYRKNDRRLAIHKEKPRHHDHHDLASSPADRYIDTDRSSVSTATDYSSPEDEPIAATEDSNQECFYNYFSHGFDIFMSQQINESTPLNPSHNPKQPIKADQDPPAESSNHLVATKLILHGNVPGSHSFNRHRRSRWVLDPAAIQTHLDETISSETDFRSIRSTLNDIWTSTITPDSQSRLTQQRHMVLNRGWGDSPGSSIELLGGWEDAELGASVIDTEQDGGRKIGMGNTELYGWPGLLFEVLKNDAVACVTVY